MRMIVKAILGNPGYQVIVASIPEEAFTLFEKEKASIDLLLTDFMMPGLNGYELKNKIEKIRPGIKMLFISVHTSDILGPSNTKGKYIHFLHKPFTVNTLAGKVREALGYSD
jgi:two-component system, cell cycle sensor histidine kinase and response regulator CckA